MAAKNKLKNALQVENIDMAGNIAAVFDYVMENASEAELLNAANWYHEAHAFCASCAQAFGLETWQVAGIVAAISPQIAWGKNKEQAIEIVARLQNSKPLAGLMAYPANLAKAKRIFQGEAPLDVLGGNKVRSFYLNIMLNEDAVTIDRHAIAIALYGLDTGKSGPLTTTDKAYRLVAQAYKDVAVNYGLAPFVVQSVTWTYKAANGGL